MYTDEDLDNAVEKGYFTATAVEQFRSDILQRKNTHAADEEDFKLVSSFNDIFVLIACTLLLVSVASVAKPISQVLSMVAVAAVSWGLAEFFVLKRKMALPAIALLMSFVGGVFAAVLLMFPSLSEQGMMLAGSAAAIAAGIHWWRFKVPITVAAGAAAVAVFFIALLVSIFPGLKANLMALLFVGGLAVFYLAMRWDSADLKRVTRKTDVAFWLHLTAAPMIVHPVFSSLGIFNGEPDVARSGMIILLYVLLSVVSLVIDRRAFMVSSLIYVLIALTDMLNKYGLAGDSFAYVGIIIGFSLLLLSGFWHKARQWLVACLPQTIRVRVP